MQKQETCIQHPRKIKFLLRANLAITAMSLENRTDAAKSTIRFDGMPPVHVAGAPQPPARFVVGAALRLLARFVVGAALRLPARLA
jgi:hypothetical protein